MNRIESGWPALPSSTRAKLLLVYLWCALLNLLVIWSFFFDDPFLQKLHLDHFTRKPFLKLIISANANWNYQLAYACTLPHYLLHLPRIVHLLDSAPQYRAVFVPEGTDHRKLGFWYFALWTLVQLLFFTVSYMEILQEYYLLLSIPALLFHWPLMFINYLMFTLPLCITHYTQLGTFLALKMIAKNTTSTLDDLLQQLKALAQLTAALHALNSFPLAVFLLSNTVDSLSVLCRLSVRFQLGLAIYFLSMFGYQLYLARLSTSTVHLLREIIRRRTGALELETIDDKDEVDENRQHRNYPIHLSQLRTLYEDRFRVRLFSLAAVDYAFIVAIALFTLKYTVFMLQTKTES